MFQRETHSRWMCVLLQSHSRACRAKSSGTCRGCLRVVDDDWPTLSIWPAAAAAAAAVIWRVGVHGRAAGTAPCPRFPSILAPAGGSAHRGPATDDIGNRLHHPSRGDLATQSRYSIRPAPLQPSQHPGTAVSTTGGHGPTRPGRGRAVGLPYGPVPHARSTDRRGRRPRAPLSPGGRTQSTKQFSCGAECITIRPCMQRRGLGLARSGGRTSHARRTPTKWTTRPVSARHQIKFSRKHYRTN